MVPDRQQSLPSAVFITSDGNFNYGVENLKYVICRDGRSVCVARLYKISLGC